jgi:hypothetical protein
VEEEQRSYYLKTVDGKRFNITAYGSMPANNNRFVDYANNADAFVTFRTPDKTDIIVQYGNIDWFNSNLPPQPSFFRKKEGLGGGNRKKKQSKKKQVKNNKSKKNRRR